MIRMRYRERILYSYVDLGEIRVLRESECVSECTVFLCTVVLRDSSKGDAESGCCFAM